MFFSKPKSILGIDIGTSHIKAVQLKRGDKPKIESYGIVNVVFPSGSERQMDAIQQVADILSQLHKKARFTTKQVVLSVPSNVAFVSVLDLPGMTEAELQKAIEYKARQFIPLPLSDVNYSWQRLEEESSLKGPKGVDAPTVKILLTAVPKNVINNYLRVLELARLEPTAIEIESISAIRSLLNPGEKSTVMVIDVGAKATILSLVHNFYLWGSRHLAVGGDAITSSIAKSLGVSFERADQLKRSATGGASPAGSASKTVIDLIKGEAQQLIRIADNQGKKVSKILLTGGGSKFTALGKEVESLGIPVSPGNPLSQVSYDQSIANRLEEKSAQLSVAIGLALRKV